MTESSTTTERHLARSNVLSSHPDGARSAFRPELHGLRAIACLIIAIYHVWLGKVSGGVDVFFFISGFLITGSMYRHAVRNNSVSFVPFWTRTFRRLTTPIVVVLGAVIIASLAFMPRSRWIDTIPQIFASLLYYENWQLAVNAITYEAASDAVSPVQHVWSLGVQAQFYLLWPFLIAALLAIAHRLEKEFRVVVLCGLWLVTAVSLAYSVIRTAGNQPFTYFDTFARIWEFSLGGILALVIGGIALPRLARLILGWLGMAGLILCGVVLPVANSFPGFVALFPILSAGAILLAGTTGAPLAVDRILTSRPVKYFGDLSFSFYLWHWPALIFFLLISEKDRASLADGLMILGAAVLLSMGTYHLIEKDRPGRAVRNLAPRRAAIGTAVILAPALLATTAWSVSVTMRTDEVFTAGDADHPGAYSLQPGFEYVGAEDPSVVPPVEELGKDWPYNGAGGCQRQSLLTLCKSNVVEDPEHTVYIVGDSHSAHWPVALNKPATEKKIQIVSVYLAGCPFTANGEAYPDPSCSEWNEELLQHLSEVKPELVLTVASRNAFPGQQEVVDPNYAIQLRRLADAGVQIGAIRDTPRFDEKMVECWENSGESNEGCEVDRSEIFKPESPVAAEFKGDENITPLDFTQSVCAEVCVPVVGNIFVFMDDNHISSTYLKTMGPFVDQEISEKFPWWKDAADR